MEISKKKDEPDGTLIPRSITTLCDTLAENMLRTMPFELLDEAVEIFLKKINVRLMKKYGHGLFKSAFLMETREKIINMEAEGPTRCEPNMQHRLPAFKHLYAEAFNGR